MARKLKRIVSAKSAVDTKVAKVDKKSTDVVLLHLQSAVEALPTGHKLVTVLERAQARIVWEYEFKTAKVKREEAKAERDAGKAKRQAAKREKLGARITELQSQLNKL